MRLSRLLWSEYVHQARSLGGRRAAEARERRRQEKRREELIVRTLPMVARIARQVQRAMLSHIDLEELEACGRLGLVEAAARYSPAAGEFEPFAYFRVRGAMVDAHKRRAYREETHDSVEAIQERLGFLPAYLSTDRGPLPDELVHRRELEQMATAAIRALPEDQKYVLLEALSGTGLVDAAAARGRSVAWARAKLAAARDTVAVAVRAA